MPGSHVFVKIIYVLEIVNPHPWYCTPRPRMNFSFFLFLILFLFYLYFRFQLLVIFIQQPVYVCDQHTANVNIDLLFEYNSNTDIG